MRPRREKMCDAVFTTNIKMLPAAVRRNRGVIWRKVAL